MILSENEARYYLNNAGFTGKALDEALKVCRCESNFDTNAHNVTEYEDSRGLMQINLKAHPFYQIFDLFNPKINTEIAYIIYKESGNNFNQWSCKSALNKKNSVFFVGIGFALLVSIYYFRS